MRACSGLRWPWEAVCLMRLWMRNLAEDTLSRRLEEWVPRTEGWVAKDRNAANTWEYPLSSGQVYGSESVDEKVLPPPKMAQGHVR